MPLIRLEDTSGLELEVHVDESRAAWVEPGATVPVMVGRADGPMEQPGRVTEISRAVEADMRAVLVTIALTEAGDLRPGMFGRARLPGPSERVLSMPAAALVRRGQLTSAFVVGDGRARLRLVRVGRQTDGQVDVLAGLTAGERVVVDPPAELRDGAWVRDSAEEAS
jgi:RND family efflux transporter MFP subunit